MLARPARIYDFTAHARRQPTAPPPGDRIDAQVANHADAIVAAQLAIEKLAAAVEAMPVAKPREPTLPTPMLYVNAGGPYAGDDAGATATSADYAQVSIEWAEHMPDTIPGNVLAVTAISGDHWSSRWWANKAANFYQALIGAATPPLPASAQIPAISLYYLAASGQTGFTLSTPDRFALSYVLRPSSQVKVSRNGARLTPDDGSGKGGYTVSQSANQVVLLWPAGQDETITVDVWEPPPAVSGGASTVYLPAANIVVVVAGVKLNAVGDTAAPIVLPTGFTHFQVGSVKVLNASIPLTAAKFGIYTAPAQSGINLVAQVLTGITSTVPNTVNNSFTAALINSGITVFNVASLYINVGTAQGAPAIADFAIAIQPLP